MFSKSATEVQTIGLLHNVYFLVKHGIPIYRAAPLHSLVDLQLNFLYDDSDYTGLSSYHRTGHNTWEFVHALNSVVESNDRTALKEAAFFSLLIDESNGISVTKHLMLYTEFVGRESYSVEVKFMKNIPLL